MQTLSAKLKREKGQVGGVTILIGTVSALFIIGFLVMIYALVGGALLNSGALYDVTSQTVLNELPASVSSTGYTLTGASDFNARSFVITGIKNATTNGLGLYNFTVLTANATIDADGLVTNASALNWANVSLNYTYVYDAQTVASGVVNSTITALSSVVTWFSIIIIITVMVVLILLTTLIIRAIRGTGFTGESA